MGKTRQRIGKSLDYAEQMFPARPRLILQKARQSAKKQLKQAKKVGLPLASNPIYLKWLQTESMLAAAKKQSVKYSGQSSMWRNPFAKPRPRAAIKKASVWYTAYPLSMITKDNQTILRALGDDELWKAFEDIGIKGMHTGPMKLAGGINGWKQTPSVDGHFDRISTEIDPMFGSKKDFQLLSTTAELYGGIIIDDIVPGHTGKSADFRLAEMGYQDYPGIYHMVEIPKNDWHLLPEIEDGKDSANLSQEQQDQLKKHGYIIGKLQRVIFYEPGVKETNWSATKAVRGVDGIKRRWVYLHYFKEGQPSLNWLDPSFAGMRLVIGDALHSLGELGSSALRLDANGFLGAEVNQESEHAWSEGHPLSGAANQLIAGMVRKLGGFTFQELNLSIDDIKATSELGADLSYDFINRPAYHHALVTGDTSFLKLTLSESLKLGIDPASLVHALQNHDEMTYELVHFWTIHKDDEYNFRGKKMTGSKLRDIVREELKDVLVEKTNYNLPFAENGIACTTASVAAAALNIETIEDIDEEKAENIKKAHLLLAAFNALQPGVFALSGWDLVGALPVSEDSVKSLLSDGDTRWINRGAYNLVDPTSASQQSNAGMIKAKNLYGDLPTQLTDHSSFASLLKRLLKIREDINLATSKQVDVPETNKKSVLAMVHELDTDKLQTTVLNFSNSNIEAVITSDFFVDGKSAVESFTKSAVGKISHKKLKISMKPYQYMSLMFE